MPRRPKPLYDLLLALFRSTDALFELLANYPYRQADNLVAALPGANVPRSTFTMQAVQQIQAHGLDREQFFDTLADRFPERSDLIQAAKRAYLDDGSSASDQTTDMMTVPDLEPTSPTALNAFEKIMGDRPTFLDVSYLALGYQRAKSVAKLRMRFPNGWFTGTAFLVKPDTLLTAHHNLWTAGDRAVEVEVIFDYESSIEGLQLESTVHRPDPESFVGDSKDDWALLRLREPQLTRPFTPLADKAASEGDRVAIIQHPNGMLKQVALHHNLVTYAGASRLQYLTDTEPGSSGSPVFDTQWNVVAVHHAGGELSVPGKKQVVYRNQGIPIQCVLAGIGTLGLSL
jgi:hypothetical protein